MDRNPSDRGSPGAGIKAALRTSLLVRWITLRGQPGRYGSRLASDGRAMADKGGSIGKRSRGV